MILGTGLGDQEVHISSWGEVTMVDIYKVVPYFVKEYHRGIESAAF